MRVLLPVLRGDGRPDSNVSIAAYRVVQEALSNVIKHAEASTVNVSMRRDPERHALEITVEDDGRGFDGSVPTAGVGLVGMRERVAAFGGRLDIQASATTGTRVSAWIPLLDVTRAGRG